MMRVGHEPIMSKASTKWVSGFMNAELHGEPIRLEKDFG
jgi:hypothetical protein